MEAFADNLNRLMGLHFVTAYELKGLIGTSMQTISAWRTARYRPTAEMLLKCSGLFEVDVNRLASAPFAAVLGNDLCDEGHFWRVERKLGRGDPWEPKVMHGLGDKL